MFKTINGGKLPTRASKYSAFVDLYTNEDVIIGAGGTVKIGLGVCIDEKAIKKIVSYHFYYKDNYSLNFKDTQDVFLKSHYLQLEPRSSLRNKGLIAGTGIIDLDYKDEIKIILHNPIKLVKNLISYNNPDYTDMITDIQTRPYLGKSYIIKKGDRIAQIALMEHKSYLFGIDSEDERVGGFGSSGDK